jgi:hypothetical protein
MMESLSLIDAVMPDIVATRQQALQQQTQQSGTVTKGPAGLIKQEQESNGDESNAYFSNNVQGLIFVVICCRFNHGWYCRAHR